MQRMLNGFWFDGRGSDVDYHRDVKLLLTLALSLLAPFFASAQTTNVISNPGFEQNTTGWFGFSPVSFTTTTTLAHSKSRSTLIQNRTDTWNGVAQSLAGVLQPNITYQISAWVRLSNAPSQTVMLTMQKTDGSGTTYQNVASVTANSNSWTQLTGGYVLKVSGALTTLNLYMSTRYSRISGAIVHSFRNAIWLNQQRWPVTGWRTTALRCCRVRSPPSGCHSNSMAVARQ